MRGQRRLIWQLFPGYLLVIFLALGIITVFTTQSIRALFQTEVAADLRVRATLTADEFAQDGASLTPDRVDDYCKRIGRAARSRITIMRPDGVVLGDTEEDPALMDNHAGRPEMAAALDGRTGEATRFSKTVKLDMMYVAVPIWRGNELAGVARVSAPLRAIAESLDGVYRRLLITGFLTALLAASLSWITTRRIVKPLDELRRGAARFAAGELDVALPAPNSQELASLSDAMNAMAHQLGARIETVLRQRKEQEAVLASI